MDSNRWFLNVIIFFDFFIIVCKMFFIYILKSMINLLKMKYILRNVWIFLNCEDIINKNEKLWIKVNVFDYKIFLRVLIGSII